MTNQLQTKIHENLESTSRFMNQLKYLDIFTENELQGVFQHRRNYEYKVYSTKCKKDVHLLYLCYELNFLELIKVRQSNKGIRRINHFVEELKFVNGLFLRSLHRYSSDVVLWKSYVDFCVENKFSVGESLTHAITKNPLCVELWLLAAKYEKEVNVNISGAKRLLQRAVNVVRKDIRLWREFFKLEILSSLPETGVILGEEEAQEEEGEDGVNVKEKRNDLKLPASERFKAGLVIYQEASQILQNYKFQIEMCRILASVPTTNQIVNELLNGIFRQYPQALLDCLTFKYSVNVKFLGETLRALNSVKGCSVEFYEQATMFLLSVGLRERRGDVVSVNLMRMFNQANSEGKMSKRMYIDLLRVLYYSKNVDFGKVAKLAEFALQKHPREFKLFELYFLALKKAGTMQDGVMTVFETYKERFRSSESFWCLVLDDLILSESSEESDSETVQDCFYQALAGCIHSRALQEKFFLWSAKSSLLGASEKNQILEFILDITKEDVIIDMILDFLANNGERAFCEKVYSKLVKKRRGSNERIWIRYIVFLREGGSVQYRKSIKVYEQALTVLKGERKQQFLREYLAL